MTVPAFQSALASTLKSITAPSFCCSGLFPRGTPDPRLRVQGMFGPLHLPLDEGNHHDQLSQLRSLSERAPCGIGTETVVDETVRRCRQIAASQLSFSRTWNTAVQALARRVAKELGVLHNAVAAHLHKLVLYSPGDMFRAHVDSEKQPGMFATLVVQLPSSYSGAILVVKHGAVETHIDLSSQESHREHDGRITPSYAAFFTDCVHEVTALEWGVRVALLYNLVRGEQHHKPARALGDDARTPNVDQRIVRRLEHCASQWSRASRSEPVPLRLMLPLQHRYTQRDVSFANLKGRDAAIVQHIRQCGAFEMRVLLVEKGDQNFANDGVDSDSEDDKHHARRIRAMSPATKRRRVLVAKNLGKEMPFEQYIQAIKTMNEKGQDRAQAKWKHNLDWKTEVLEGNLFNSPGLPVDGDYRVTGNEGIRIDLKYQRAVLAMWPKANAPLLAMLPKFEQHVNELRDKIITASAFGEHDAQWLVVASMSAFYPQLALQSLPTLLDVACRRGDRQVVKRLLWQATGVYTLWPDADNRGYREVYTKTYIWRGLVSGKHVAALLQAIELCGVREVCELVKSCVMKSGPEFKHCFELCHALLDIGDTARVKLVVDIGEQMMQCMWRYNERLVVALLLRDECSPLHASFLKKLSSLKYDDFDDEFLICVLKETQLPNRSKARAFFFQPVFKMCTQNMSAMKEDDVALLYKIAMAHEKMVDVEELSTQVRRTKSCVFVHMLLHHADILALAETDAVRRVAQWHAERLRKVQSTRLAVQPDTEIEGHPALSEFLRGDAEEFVTEALESSEEATRLSDRLSGFSVWTKRESDENGERLRVERCDKEKWNVTLTAKNVNKKMTWLRRTYMIEEPPEI